MAIKMGVNMVNRFILKLFACFLDCRVRANLFERVFREILFNIVEVDW